MTLAEYAAAHTASDLLSRTGNVGVRAGDIRAIIVTNVLQQINLAPFAAATCMWCIFVRGQSIALPRTGKERGCAIHASSHFKHYCLKPRWFQRSREPIKSMEVCTPRC